MRVLFSVVASIVVMACTIASPAGVTEAEPDLQLTTTPGAIVIPVQPDDATQTDVATVPPTETAEAEEEVVDVPTATAAATEIAGQVYPPDMNPLTGQIVEDISVLQRRPIVAKISNAPPLVRPQAGVGQADLVFEHYAEGGLTRFSAVYYGTSPARVGSVRSARLIDYELSAMYRAILAFSGGSTGVEERIYGTEAMDIVDARLAQGKPILPPSDFAERAYKGVLYGAPYYFRDETIPVPHNLFVNPQAIWQLASTDGINERQDLQGMTFSADVPANENGTANALDVRYRATRVQWTYDAEQGVYMRMSDGLPHFDATTNQQVSAQNVVVVYANHYFTDIVESEWQGSRSYSIEIEVWFEGEALLLRDGRYYEARWHRPTRESLIYLETKDGEPLAFKPGQTWFQLVRLPEQMEAESEWVRVE